MMTGQPSRSTVALLDASPMATPDASTTRAVALAGAYDASTAYRAGRDAL
jgi:hypothetical protein